MKEEKTLYCFMNKNFEFIGERDNITDDLKEAIGFEDYEVAKAYAEDFDEPEIWKIVKKKVTFTLEEIIE